MEISELIKKHLAESRMMQIATSDNRQPWICTVYYVEDDKQNLYWLSLPTRRHSQEIASSSKIAVAIPVKFDKNPIIGIQAEGLAEVINVPAIVAEIMQKYTEKYESGKDFYDNFLAGKNQHLLYKFTPSKYVLFDEVSFPENTRKEWNL